MSEAYGTTVVRRIPVESEWIDITCMGDPVPTLIERWRGWIVDLWCDWSWT